MIMCRERALHAKGIPADVACTHFMGGRQNRQGRAESKMLLITAWQKEESREGGGWKAEGGEGDAYFSIKKI